MKTEVIIRVLAARQERYRRYGWGAVESAKPHYVLHVGWFPSPPGALEPFFLLWKAETGMGHATRISAWWPNPADIVI